MGGADVCCCACVSAHEDLATLTRCPYDDMEHGPAALLPQAALQSQAQAFMDANIEDVRSYGELREAVAAGAQHVHAPQTLPASAHTNVHASACTHRSYQGIPLLTGIAAV